MNIHDALKLIHTDKPKIIYISGKTSTGKTTFANKLCAEYGYTILGLDNIVNKHVIDALDLQNSQQVFIEVYRRRTETEWLRRFITAARKGVDTEITAGKKVILEGAVAHTDTLKDLLIGFEVLFLYFHPASLEQYYSFLLSRFEGSSRDNQNSLPLLFWDQIKDSALEAYYTDRKLTAEIESSIQQYAKISQAESLERLNTFKEHFSDIVVVEI